MIGKLNQVTIRLSSNPKVCQVIDILVVDIPEFYGLIISRDWSEKLLPTAVISQASHEMGRPPTNVINKVDLENIALIGGRSRSHTPPFLLTYEVFNKNLNNYLVDSGASSNILPKSICAKLNIQPQKSVVRIV